MVVHSKSEAESVECGFQMSRSINQECGVGELLFLSEFTEKQHGELRFTGLKEPYVKELVCFGVDSSVQPVALAVEANHGFVNRNLIRTHIAVGL